MQAALVTGGEGFIGAAVVRALRRAGYATAIAGTSSDRLTAARIAALDVDVDVIVHCAGGSSVAASVNDPAGDFEKTVPPFKALIERVRGGRARVVLVSSGAVYGAAAVRPTPETSPVAPVSPYGEHKRMCEELCAGARAVVVRLFSVYGPGLRRQLVWDACVKARANAPTFAGSGNEERDWLHVDDAAALLVAAASHASTEVPIVNGGSGVGVRVRDVVGQICRELGAREPTFTGSARAGDPPSYVADITRARALGWAPTIELAHGISETVAWFREQR